MFEIDARELVVGDGVRADCCCRRSGCVVGSGPVPDRI